MKNLLRRRQLIMRKAEEAGEIRAVCFEAEGDQTVAVAKYGSAPSITLQYSYDEKSWSSWDLSAIPFGGDTKVYIRGINNIRFSSSTSAYNYFVFGTSAYTHVSGILESLLNSENKVTYYSLGYIFCSLFKSQKALRSADKLIFETSRLYSDCYTSMFNGCTSLTTAPELPVTTLSDYCYNSMFSGCTSLITAPKLPATTLAKNCYSYMFNGCTSLTTAPELLATTLKIGCYSNMFYGCTSLTTAPKLLATTLATSCCASMFVNCYSLTSAPELLATKLESGCYRDMFNNCRKLRHIKCYAKTTASNATRYWVISVPSSGTFEGYSSYSWSTGESGIPAG